MNSVLTITHTHTHTHTYNNMIIIGVRQSLGQDDYMIKLYNDQPTNSTLLMISFLTIRRVERASHFKVSVRNRHIIDV